MIATLSFVLIVLVNMLVMRGGAVALKLTGLSWDVASFQAQSAFTGAGFTTSESEHLISHPARRKIVGLMMSLGSIGVGSALVTVVVTLTTAGEDLQQRTWLMLGSLLGLSIAVRTKFIDRLFIPVVTRLLLRSRTLRIHDYEELLRMDKGFSVAQLTVEEDSWLTGGPLDQEFTLLSDETVVWGGSAGGFGTGGRWSLRDDVLEIIRTTPLGIVTGGRPLPRCSRGSRGRTAPAQPGFDARAPACSSSRPRAPVCPSHPLPWHPLP